MASHIIERVRVAAARHARKRIDFPTLGESLSYGELWRGVMRVARSLAALDLRRGEPIGLLFGTSPGFLYSFLGTLASRSVAVPLPHPSVGSGLSAYVARLTHIVRDGDLRFVIVGDEFEDYAEMLDLGVRVLRVGDLLSSSSRDPQDPQVELPTLDPGARALVQYTSGSTSVPKGVALTHANLDAGVTAIVEGAKVTEHDVNGQWLPLHHDMGLIGMLAGLTCGVTHHLWSPASFVRSPGAWLGEFAARRATVYAGPSFSFTSMLEKVTDEQLRALDLSAWRIAFNGAEVIHAPTVTSFLSRFGPAGFSPATMFPVYGLAEATLAVTFPEVGSTPVVEWVDRSALGRGLVERVEGPASPNARGLVGVGRPVLGHEVRILGETGEALSERRVGEIAVRGPAVMSAYFGRSAADSGILPGGWFQTGDLGYLSGAHLFVSGRTKEMIVFRGVNYYPQDIEATVAGLPGVFRRRVIAFSLEDGDGERLGVMLESVTDDLQGLARSVRERVLHEVGLPGAEVFVLEPRSIGRTTSGKYQRVLMRDRLLRGELGDALVHSETGGGRPGVRRPLETHPG